MVLARPCARPRSGVGTSWAAPGALLVLLVLAGLLAMHGLAPGGNTGGHATSAGGHAASAHGRGTHGTPGHADAPVHGAGPRTTGPATGAHTTGVMVSAAAPGDCTHRAADGRSGGGHAEHADTTCAAGGISTAPLLDLPAAAPYEAYELPRTGGRSVGAGARERAPPSLAELQLLRI